MKRTCLPQLVAGFIILQLGVGGAFAADRTHEIGIQAYVYAYPMIMMEVTRRVSTNVEAPVGAFAPMNQFAHLGAFPDHTFKYVVRPNADTLYSIVWFDVSKEPQVLSVSDTGGRYYMLPMLDMWTDIIAAPGSRTSGTKAANFAIVGPKWQGDLPDGVELVRSPTNVGWIIGRTQTNGAADYKNVHRIQEGYKLTPLSQWGKSYTPPSKVAVNSTWDMKTPPPVQVARMSAKTYFELFAKLLEDNPPHELDWNMVEQLKQIGIIPGEDFDFSKLSAEAQGALERAVGDAQKMIVEKQTGEAVNGWQFARELMGNYGTSYLRRAYIALIGLGANVPEDAVYPMSNVDSEGQPYNGSQRYVLHFDKGELPPTRGFWSLSMYDDEMYFVDNPIRRYAIGDRDKLQFNKDGSLDIYIQHASPGKVKESNWLPAPEGDFDLVLRAYWPMLEVLAGGWNPPAVKRAN
ncbi:MAG: DUF1254 domain-containing protein [Acidiferrobacterales bacterium]|jgi:hypothetical protein